MNKYKKITTAVVSLVLAGTMVGSMAACDTPGTSGGSSKYNLEVKLDENGKLTYNKGTKIVLNIGNQNSTHANAAYTSFQTDNISGSTYLIDGNYYTAGDLRPAWQAVSDILGVTLEDKFANVSSDAQVEDPISNKNLGNFDVISASLSAINQNSGGSNFVNLAKYLEYMPNYKKFLDDNPVTVYSLTGEATGANAGAMYAAPYFDGNKDIENYALIRKDWVRLLLDTETLDSSKFITFAAQAKSKDAYDDNGTTKQRDSIIGTKTSIESYMGKTGSYDIDVVNSDNVTVETIKVNYDKALAAAKDTGSALGAAINAAAGKAYNGESGNIVDLQNFVINETSGNVTGDKLAKIVREYILVTYVKGETPYYTTPSDVFNSVSAAWDVDLLAATLRVIVTAKADKNGGGIFEEVEAGDVWGIAARQATTQRRVNLYSLAAELYGVRGLESRLEYLYVDSDGNLKDARQDASSYELVSNLSKFSKEGILYTGSAGEDGKNSYYTTGSKAVLAAMSYDYVQTQTRNAMSSSGVPRGYDYAPILTPVSKWNDGKGEKIMRFTESWRSVKNTGFCVPSAAVANNPDKLSAVLTLIDYMFSEDGQVLLTYGTPSTTDSYDAAAGTASDNGWWYAKESSLSLSEVAEKKVDAYGPIKDQYEVKKDYKTQVFVYEGKVYEGVVYGGRVVPQITKANRALFEGKEITVTAKDGKSGKVKQNGANLLVNQVGNYTNYARLVLGTTMPVGNKNQGFEYQCTANCGRAGAEIVDKAIQAGVINHVVTDPADASNPWYFISPTVFPLTSGNRSTLTNTAQGLLSGTYFVNSSKSDINVYIDLIFYGLGSKEFLGSSTNIAGQPTAGTLKSSGEEYITFLNSGNLNGALNARANIYKLAWNNLKAYYKISFS